MKKFLKITDNALHDHHEVRAAADPKCLNAHEFWDDEMLEPYGYRVVNVTYTDPPEVERPYSIGEPFFDEPELGELVQVWPVIEPTLEAAQAYAMARLNHDFDTGLLPVDYDGKTWKPGHSSAAVIRDVAEMAEQLGLTEVTLTDIDNIEHVYSLANARLVGASIGVAYQQAFLARAAKRRAIADAETVAEALAVLWNDPAV